MKFTIDRFEGDIAIVELENREIINISRKILPLDSKEGDIICLQIDQSEIEDRQKRIQDKFSMLLNNKTGGDTMKFCWTTLYVKDMEESLSFYKEIVGLKIHQRLDAGPDMEIVFLGEGETKLELIYDKNKQDINIGLDISVGFEVDSVDEKISFLKEKDISIYSGPVQPSPNVKFFHILDPNGLRLQFVENIK